jgi:hypothetical protein
MVWFDLVWLLTEALRLYSFLLVMMMINSDVHDVFVLQGV